MRDDIKKRIETIRRGEVPEDYIRTEFGVMPKEWRKLLVGDVIEFYSEKSTKNNEYPVLTSSRSGLALQTEYFEGQVTREENAGYNIIPYGYCTFRSRSDDGQFTFNQNTIIDKGIVSCFYPVFRVKEAVAVDTFVLCFLNNYLGRQILKEIVGTSQLVLSEKKLNSLRIAVPPVSEQKKIAKILSVCDRAIELKQKLVEELQSLKKTCLSKMFPRNGENVPELRFPSFTAPWEQRKLDDIFDFLQNNTLSRADLDTETGVAKNVHYGDVLIKFGEYLDASSSTLPYIPSQPILDKFKGSLLQDGDVIMADTAEDEAVGKCTEITGLQGFPTISGLHTIPLRPKEKFAPGYLGYYMNSGSYHDQLLPLMQGIKVTSVSKSAILNTDISYPVDNDEQAKIGGFFIRLENLITLHQRELEEERKRKTTLMRLLLTGIVRVNA
jgi:type I restriction enzyme S subunit